MFLRSRLKLLIRRLWHMKHMIKVDYPWAIEELFYIANRDHCGHS
ncbi:MAG: hypothetical protein A4E47_00030 [Methanosaeta sp. PtaU1.Bin028]|nr:MAG: hypothetical protein A4E47_00030 [Methanosaeta sp. PtaU1.Bin028]